MFKSLVALKDAKQEVCQIQESLSLEIRGTILIKKGDLSVELDYYTNIYEVSGVKNAIGMDDWDINGSKYSIAGLEIDNFESFKKGLIDHGMTSVANILQIDTRSAIVESLKTNSIIKKMYGKNVIIWDALSTIDRKKIFLDMIEKGEDVPFHHLRVFNWIDENGKLLPLDIIKDLESDL